MIHQCSILSCGSLLRDKKMKNRSLYYCLALILFSITACSRIINTPSPTATIPVTIPQSSPSGAITPTANLATPIPTTPRNDSRWYGLDVPIANDSYSSPMRFTGSTNMTPGNKTIYVTLLDEAALVLAQEPVTIQGEVNQPGTFSGMIFFPNYNGPGWVTIREKADGEDIYTAAVTFVSDKP
jgi:hypothetical protein